MSLERRIARLEAAQPNGHGLAHTPAIVCDAPGEDLAALRQRVTCCHCGVVNVWLPKKGTLHHGLES
jgi:hypothetical protein